MLERYFQECENYNLTKLKSSASEFFIYKGFKLEKTNEGIIYFLDVRFNDFYNKVRKQQKKLFKKHGFIRACNIILYKRDIMRSNLHNKKLQGLYQERDFLKRELEKSNKKRDYLKKLRINQKKIQDNIDLFIYYDSRKEQFNINENKKGIIKSL